MKIIILILIVLTASSLLPVRLRGALVQTPPGANTTRSRVRQEQVNSQWHPAVYRGLTIGRSTRDDVIRVLGLPKWSEVFNDGVPEPEEWMHYQGLGEFPGELVFCLIQKDGVVHRLILHPTKLSKDDAIKHFGENYKLTRYELCKGFEDEDSAPVYETPTGQFLRIEYRAKGISLAINDKNEVTYISYVSEPIGSKCKQAVPQTGTNRPQNNREWRAATYNLTRAQAVKHFGPDFIVTRYALDDCLRNEESAAIYEDATGPLLNVEYRHRGIAIAVTESGKVNSISFVNKAVGSPQ
jgi:hypothetical protein